MQVYCIMFVTQTLIINFLLYCLWPSLFWVFSHLRVVVQWRPCGSESMKCSAYLKANTQYFQQMCTQINNKSNVSHFIIFLQIHEFIKGKNPSLSNGLHIVNCCLLFFS